MTISYTDFMEITQELFKVHKANGKLQKENKTLQGLCNRAADVLEASDALEEWAKNAELIKNLREQKE